MATVYPSQIDTVGTLPTVVDNITGVSAITVNILRDTLLAIESNLGINPATTYTTVRNRLDSLETALNQIVSGGVGTNVHFGGDLSGNLLTQTVVGLQGRGVSSATPATNQILTWSGAIWEPANAPVGFSAGGDLSGSATSQTVIGLQGRTVSSSTPSSTDVLTWNGSEWTPSSVPITVTGAYCAGIFSGVASTTQSSANPQQIGSFYFKPGDWPNGYKVHLRVVIETTNASNTANIDLADQNNILGGGFGAEITGSNLTTTSTTATEVETELTALEGLSAGTNVLISIRLWINPTSAGQQATCAMAQLVVS